MEKIIFLVLFLVPNFLFAQINEDAKRDNVWVTGYKYDFSLPEIETLYFNFNNDSLEVLFDSMDIKQFEIRFTSGSICDKDGNLLFYTNGCQIADVNHNIIQGGEVINAGDIWDSNCPTKGYTVPQGIIIIPKPNYEDTYWMFSQKKQLVWGQNVLGDVSNLMLNEIHHDTITNDLIVNFVDSSLVADTLFGGHLAACRHGNGRDWWVIQPELNTSGYYNFLVSPSGVELVEHQYIGDTLVVHLRNKDVKKAYISEWEDYQKN